MYIYEIIFAARLTRYYVYPTTERSNLQKRKNTVTNHSQIILILLWRAQFSSAHNCGSISKDEKWENYFALWPFVWSRRHFFFQGRNRIMETVRKIIQVDDLMMIRQEDYSSKCWFYLRFSSHICNVYFFHFNTLNLETTFVQCRTQSWVFCCCRSQIVKIDKYPIKTTAIRTTCRQGAQIKRVLWV